MSELNLRESIFNAAVGTVVLLEHITGNTDDEIEEVIENEIDCEFERNEALEQYYPQDTMVFSRAGRGVELTAEEWFELGDPDLSANSMVDEIDAYARRICSDALEHENGFILEHDDVLAYCQDFVARLRGEVK